MDGAITQIIGGSQNPDRHTDRFIPINKIIWGDEERRAVADVFDRDWFGPGYYTQRFADALAMFTGTRFVQPVNSGSSALLLTVQSLLYLEILKPGDTVLHPVCTFPTSLNPLLQSGLDVMLVDVDLETCNIRPDAAKEAMATWKIDGLLLPHLLGNATDLDTIFEEHTAPLIEDSCDTLGSTYRGKMLGSVGRAGCLSFYGSHHISSGGVGGAAITDDQDIYDVVKSLTAWGRDDFQQEKDIYERFKARYRYITIGYDMQMTEFQAAFGLAQMARLADFNRMRRERFARHQTFFEENGGGNFILPQSYPKVNPSWFAYPLILSETAAFDRKTLVEYLVDQEIECRPLFVGNILEHPAYQRPEIRSRIKVFDGTSNADYLHEHGLFIPCWPMPERVAERLYQTLYDFLKEYK